MGERKEKKKEDMKQLMSRPVKSSEVGVSPQQWQPRECCQNAMYTSWTKINSSVFGNQQQALNDDTISHQDVASSKAGGQRVRGQKARLYCSDSPQQWWLIETSVCAKKAWGKFLQFHTQTHTWKTTKPCQTTHHAFPLFTAEAASTVRTSFEA